LPVCDAVIVHVPVVRSVTLEPETVQTLGVELAKDTVSPLDAVAESETGPWSTRVSAGAPKVIDCEPGDGDAGTAVTWKVRVTSTAAAYVPLPACDAVSEQVPVATSVTVVPVTVQTDGVEPARLTPSPLEALAESVTGP
jgi:hypothetical protein